MWGLKSTIVRIPIKQPAYWKVRGFFLWLEWTLTVGSYRIVMNMGFGTSYTWRILGVVGWLIMYYYVLLNSFDI